MRAGTARLARHSSRPYWLRLSETRISILMDGSALTCLATTTDYPLGSPMPARLRLPRRVNVFHPYWDIRQEERGETGIRSTSITTRPAATQRRHGTTSTSVAT